MVANSDLASAQQQHDNQEHEQEGITQQLPELLSAGFFSGVFFLTFRR
jgi:hypothetical protein